MPAGLQLPVWSQPGLRCVFLSPLYGLQQGSSSPEVMMASFLAEIWKEQEILWLSSEGWLYYWDTTNKGWCRPGIPRLALALSLSFLPLWSLFPTSSLILSLLREGLQYLELIRKHIHLQSKKKTKNKINRSSSVCWKSLTATCAMIQPPNPPTAVLYKSQQSDCRLFTSQASDEAARLALAVFPTQASHGVTHTIQLPPSKFSCPAKNDIWKIKLFEGGRLWHHLIQGECIRWCRISLCRMSASQRTSQSVNDIMQTVLWQKIQISNR